MSRAAQLRTVLLAASLLTPMAARADVSPGQAKQLEGQIRAWLTVLLGPNVPLAARPIHVTPEGDHYRLGIEIAGSYGKGVTVSADPLSALVKPLDGARWAVDDLRLPSPLRIDNAGVGSDKLKSMATKIADQSAKGVLDLSFATTSTLEQSLRGYTSVTENATGSQTTHVDSYTAHNTWQPAGDGSLNVLADGTGEGISADSTAPDGTPVKIAAKRFEFTGHVDHVAVNQVGDFIRSATDLIPVFAAAQAASEAPVPSKGPNTAKPGPIPPQDAPADDIGVPIAARAPLRAMLASASGMMGALEEQFSLKDLSLEAAGHSATMRNAMMGLGFGAPDGRVDAHMSMALDGLDSPEIPPGVFHDYLPKHLSLKPRVSGVPSADVVALLRHVIESDGQEQDALTAEAIGLLAKGPLSVGIDDLDFDFGPAMLHGAGAVQITDPQTIAGTAQVRVTGYDTLMQQANTTPMLQQAAPVLIFLKGIGKQDGDAVVWNIAYEDSKLLVNGADLSAMMPNTGK